MRVRHDVDSLIASVRRISSTGRGGRPTVVEHLVTAVMLVLMLGTASLRTGSFAVPEPALLVFTILAWGALLFRTYRPVPALAGTVLFEACILVFLAVPTPLALESGGMGAYQPVPLASMVAAYTVASRASQRFGWTAGGVAGGVLFTAALLTHPTTFVPVDLVMFYLVLSGTSAGVVVSARRERTARDVLERAENTRKAVLDERLRIARELHDVLAHNLTLVNAQAGVAEYLLQTRPEAAATALHDITQHTARAIDELRATIGLLRNDAAETAAEQGLTPVPGLSRLAELVESFGSAPTAIELSISGEPRELDQQADLAAYRIVQEALTNATKHAPDAAVLIALAWSDDGLAIRISNSAAPRGGRDVAPGTGHGLIGMRERAAAAGGTFASGLTSDGGYIVMATLPTGSAVDPSATVRQGAAGPS